MSQKYCYDFIYLSEKALDNYIADYKTPSRRDWTIAMFDDENTVIGMTKVTWQGIKWDYIYVGTLNFDEDGKVVSGTHHYVQLGNEVLHNDGYCDEFFEYLNEIQELFNENE